MNCVVIIILFLIVGSVSVSVTISDGKISWMFVDNPKSVEMHYLLVANCSFAFHRNSIVNFLDGDRGNSGFVWSVSVSLGLIRGTPPPQSGDWIINDTTLVENSTLIINGSIIVNTSGALILKNSQIYMNLSSDGEHWIDIYGNLTMLGSLITAYNTSNNYYIRVFSDAKLRIEDSEISYAGYAWGDKSGLWINSENATIKNTTILNNYHGVALYRTNNTEISNNIIQNNSRYGVYLEYSSYNNISGNTIQDNENGVWLDYSSYNNISCNTIGNNWWDGIVLCVSSDNHIYDNMILDNTLDGVSLYLASNNNISGNIIQGNEDGIHLDSSFGNNVSCNMIRKNENGINLRHSHGIRISHNTVQSNKNGIYLYRSQYNDISNNTMQNNENSVYLSSSDNNTIFNNTFVGGGIFVSYSYNNTIDNNMVNGKSLVYLENVYGVTVSQEAGQIILVQCGNITIRNQNITDVGIAIELWKTNNTKIYNNTIQDNQYGLYLLGSFNNKIFYNNFINNTQHINWIDVFTINQWTTTNNITYTYRGKTFISQLGNY